MKLERHSCIRDLLNNFAIANQEEFRIKLADRGFHVTQATLSRDIKELGLSKGPHGYSLSLVNAVQEDSSPGIQEVIRSFGLEIRQAMNLLILITRTGGAQPVAAGIDYENWSEVIGTIAGDDTVLIISANNRDALKVKKRIDSYLP